jgi:hypothetical protein
MFLAVALSTDTDAVICDLAETYGVYDYRALSVETLAALVCGLRADSRIKMRLAGYKGQELPMRALLAKCADLLALMLHCWTAKSDDPVPDMFVDCMVGKEDSEDNSGFDTIEEYEAARQRFLKG